jgi:hypothetical protein
VPCRVMQDLPDFVPHFRIAPNHLCAMAPTSPPCSFIHASMAGSRSTAPLNRSNSVLILAAFSLSDRCYVAPLHETKGMGPRKTP